MTQIILSPLLPWFWVVAAVLPAALLCLYRRLWLRAGLCVAMGVFLLQPLQQQLATEETTTEAVVITDSSRSTAPQSAIIEAVTHNLQQRLAALPGVEVRHLVTTDTAARGSTPLEDTWAEITRLGPGVAGVFLVTDGRVSIPDTPYPLPLHILNIPAPATDRWVEITAVPSYALVGKPQSFTYIVHDPDTREATVDIHTPDDHTTRATVKTNTPVTGHFTLGHTGLGALSISTPLRPGEAVSQNNRAAALINGVRETFSVLLITGSPHNGTRSLRQVLKGDAGVNLVHFSILRTPFSQDGAGRHELSLIPFPTEKLFGEQLKDFDLVVFDNFIANNLGLYDYYGNILRYVREGGSLFVLGNDAMAEPDGLMQTPLAALMPFHAATSVTHQPFTPQLTPTGRQHPVTAPLADQAATWGPLAQRVNTRPFRGQVLMADPAMHPLLVLDSVGQGRVATLLTNDLWRWGRSLPGGPQTELLKRIAHWLMHAPQLEASQLRMSAIDGQMTLAYQGLPPPAAIEVQLTLPDGTRRLVTLTPGDNFTTHFEAIAQGLYTATNTRGTPLQAYAVVGSAQDHEWRSLPGQPDKLSAYARRSGGRVFEVTPHKLPEVKKVKAGGRTSSRGWVGLPAPAANSSVVAQKPLLAPWAWLILLLGLMLATWAHEGRFIRRR